MRRLCPCGRQLVNNPPPLPTDSDWKTTGKVRIARHPVAFIHQLVKLIVRHSLSVTTRSRRDGLRADYNDSAVGDVIPVSIKFRVISDVLAVRYRDAFVEDGFTNLAA